MKKLKKLNGFWAYYKVIIISNTGYLEHYGFYVDNQFYTLESASGYKGFGGVEYKEEPNMWYERPLFITKIDLNRPSATRKLATPNRVKFWMEK